MSEERALVARSQEIALGTVRAASPAQLVEAASVAAKSLADVVRGQKLAVRIQGREYVKVEGWTTLAAMLGVTPREVEVVEHDDGARYVARVELVRMSDGVPLASASAECGTDEKRWADAPRYARRSMAITRATSKACRMAFSWVMSLAGYETTPAEEIVDVVVDQAPAQSPAPRVISASQAKRLWAKAYSAGERAGMTKDGVKDVVSAVLESKGYASTREIKREDYEAVIEEIERSIAPPPEPAPEASPEEPPF